MVHGRKGCSLANERIGGGGVVFLVDRVIQAGARAFIVILMKYEDVLLTFAQWMIAPSYKCTRS